MNDAQLRDAAWNEFTQTTLGYTKMKQPLAATSHWAKGKAYLDQIGVAPPPPPPPPPPPVFDPHTAWRYSPWNLNATTQPLHSNSAAMIATWIARGNLNYPNVCTNRYSQAWCIGKAGDPLYDIPITIWGKRTIYGVPIPVGTVPSPDTDTHLAIFDTVNMREIDLWKAAFVNGAWTAGSGDVYPLGQNPAPGTGSNAAGFPPFGVSIWPEEIAAGRIDHALAFSVCVAAPSHVYPATKHDGQGDAQDLPEGSWLALPVSSLPNPSWPAWAKTVHTALIAHGMYLMDQGGTLGIGGVNPINGGTKWDAVGMGTGGSCALPSDFPFDKMRVLAVPS